MREKQTKAEKSQHVKDHGAGQPQALLIKNTNANLGPKASVRPDAGGQDLGQGPERQHPGVNPDDGNQIFLVSLTGVDNLG